MGKLVRGLDNALFMYGGGGTDSSFFSNLTTDTWLTISQLVSVASISIHCWAMDGETMEILEWLVGRWTGQP
jgi:hypothetical protein